MSANNEQRNRNAHLRFDVVLIHIIRFLFQIWNLENFSTFKKNSNVSYRIFISATNINFNNYRIY